MPYVRNVLHINYQQANLLGCGCFNTSASSQPSWCMGLQKVNVFPASLTCQHGTNIILLYAGQKCLSALYVAVLLHLSAHALYKFCTLKAYAMNSM